MALQIRRVVTGHDANNVAKVLIDAPATNAKGTEGRSTLMWITDQNPADILNLFGEVKVLEQFGTPAYVRVGRQELLYGSERLISPLDFA